MSFRFPYLSLDIETTGVDTEKSQVLQLAAVFDVGDELEFLPTFNTVIKHPVITHGESFPMNMNKHLVDRAFRDENVDSLDHARINFRNWLAKIKSKGLFTVAGKNAASFDIPILRNPANQFNTSRFRHAVLDPGSMFSEDFDHIPNLGEINRMTGRPDVTHDALEDSWDVVYAIRYKWGV